MRYLAICLIAVAGLVGRSEGQGQLDYCRADFDSSGSVDFGDFLLFAQAFGKQVREPCTPEPCPSFPHKIDTPTGLKAEFRTYTAYNRQTNQFGAGKIIIEWGGGGLRA